MFDYAHTHRKTYKHKLWKTYYFPFSGKGIISFLVVEALQKLKHTEMVFISLVKMNWPEEKRNNDKNNNISNSYYILCNCIINLNKQLSI